MNVKSLASAMVTMASSLKSARKPASDLQGDESSVVKLCRNFIEADATKSLYRIDIVRESTDGAKLLVFQQHFAEYEGKSLKLPQDIRAMPTDKDGKLSSDCTTIANDGSLTDA